ncbi:hypothetical protein LEP1GSC185_3309 [Leptospira licerasiae serovar Varillal str. VAR 010]|nr:hypothetical protein LEP1GSC185_3309 [Leptospira licerasiae serovar Varillal str. VAR 010]
MTIIKTVLKEEEVGFLAFRHSNLKVELSFTEKTGEIKNEFFRTKI